MRTAAEPSCNMTLTRSEWSVLVALLDWAVVSHPWPTSRDVAKGVRSAVLKALKDEPFAAEVAIPRETDKWAGVSSLVFSRIHNVLGGCALYDRLRKQIQSSQSGDQ